jgi:hypothetical protein
MKIEKERLEQLKQQHPGGVFEGSIDFSDEEDKKYEIEFLYRRPTTADIESYSKSAQRNPLVANLNLIQSLIILPEPGPVIAQIREYPAAYGRFVDEAVMPFFGGDITVKRRKL